MLVKGPALPVLRLPPRYEKLEQYAGEANIAIEAIVRPVRAATSRIDALLQKVRGQGLGRFEFFDGLSGSGKTTFLRTLPKFFKGASIFDVPKEVALANIPTWLRERRIGLTETSVYALHGRDNPEAGDAILRAFYEELRVFFREEGGAVVLVWPITAKDFSERAAKIAWDIGRDSVVDGETLGRFEFVGLEKSSYFETADTTAQSVNDGHSLEAFGITRQVAETFLPASATISAFYSKLQDEASRVAGKFGEVLKERIIPRVWILVASDDSKESFQTVSQLTHGVRGEVDVRRLLAYLDDPALDAGYLKEWKKRRAEMVLLMTMLDVRLFVLAPNVSLGAVRLHGSENAKAELQTKIAAEDAVLNALRAASFYKGILNPTGAVVTTPSDTATGTRDDFNRLQQLASKDDKSLNKALGILMQAALTVDGFECTVVAEKQSLPDSSLKPDVQVIPAEGRLLCIEPTWRTTGVIVPGGRQKPAQNTLTAGHIQQYLLQKVLAYVQDLDL